MHTKSSLIALSAVASVFTSACGRENPTAATPRTIEQAPVQSQSVPHHGAKAPVTVLVEGPSSVVAASTIIVEVRITFNGPAVPVDLTVIVPSGTRLVGGLPKEALAANSSEVVRRFDLAVDAVPAKDFAVVVQGHGGVTSVRAEQFYRFGRAAPRLSDPPRAPRPLTVPGQNLGTPIQLPPPTHP